MVNDLENLIIENKPVVCDVCGAKLVYATGGRYVCEKCGQEYFDNFGKVKAFLEEHGVMPLTVIAEATGVDSAIIEKFLKKGRVEIPDGSKYYLKCERCGCSIRFGRFCPDCVKDMADGIEVVLNEDVGEKPKYELKKSQHGKMHLAKYSGGRRRTLNSK